MHILLLVGLLLILEGGSALLVGLDLERVGVVLQALQINLWIAIRALVDRWKRGWLPLWCLGVLERVCVCVVM